MEQNQYYVELTDTFGGEANYSWLNRYLITASSTLGVINKLAKHSGYRFKKNYESNDITCYEGNGCCVIAFIALPDNDDLQYANIVL
jgi:hypothetical protein